MNTSAKLFGIIVILLSLNLPLPAALINVPADQETIQAGIDASEDGDTVLVAPGSYEENLIISGRRIVLGSHYLTTGDTTYVDSTIIDGNEQGSVVTFAGGDSSTFTGFSIRNGAAENGGGIFINEAKPTFLFLQIFENEASNRGGGLYVRTCSVVDTLTMEHLTISENSATQSGGGVYLLRGFINFQDLVIQQNSADYGGAACASSWSRGIEIENGDISLNKANNAAGIYMYCGPWGIFRNLVLSHNQAEINGGGMIIGGGSRLDISYSQIVHNVAGEQGGGIYTSGGCPKHFNNVTIAHNNAPVGGGLLNIDRGLNYINNSIIWDNGPNNIYLDEESQTTIAYTDLERGEEDLVVEGRARLILGEGLVCKEPEFVNPGQGDFRLLPDSPCIDAGDPDSPLDPDSTCADMGWVWYPQFGWIGGSVSDAENDRPLAGCFVQSSSGKHVFTNLNGLWRIGEVPGVYNYTITQTGYNEASLADQQVALFDTLHVQARMYHPTFLLSVEQLAFNSVPGDSVQAEITVNNPANGELHWSVETTNADTVVHSPWSLQESLFVGEEVDDNQINGVVLVNDRYYITGNGNETDYIYVLDRNGSEIHRFEQFVDSRRGMHDLAYDGELIWGEKAGTIFGFTTEGEIIQSWRHGLDYINSLAWDPDREILWISFITSNIYGFTRNGELVAEIPIDNLLIYGLAYFAAASDGRSLYVFHDNRIQDSQDLYGINPDTQESSLVRHLEPLDGGRSRGLFVTNCFVPERDWTILCAIDATNEQGRDRIDIYHLQTSTTWATLTSRQGIIPPGQSESLILSLFTSDPLSGYELPLGQYHWNILFTHNAIGGTARLPITLNVVDPAGVSDRDIDVPVEFGISSTYPNPFNSTVRIAYSLPARTDLALSVFDLAGREVTRLVDGSQSAGRHTAEWDGQDATSGVYLIRLMDGNGRQQRMEKIVLVK